MHHNRDTKVEIKKLISCTETEDLAAQDLGK